MGCLKKKDSPSEDETHLEVNWRRRVLRFYPHYTRLNFRRRAEIILPYLEQEAQRQTQVYLLQV